MRRWAIAFAVTLLLGCGREARHGEPAPVRPTPSAESAGAKEPAGHLSPLEPPAGPPSEPEAEAREEATADEPESAAEAPTNAPGESTGEGAVEEPSNAGEPSRAGERRCPPGTCVVRRSRGCERPTGQLGNGCCRCGDDGRCATHCRCNGPRVPVDTPEGPRPIGELRVGDLVYSRGDDGERVVAAVCAVARRPAPRDGWVRVTTTGGRSFVTSAVHPIDDGRTVSELSMADGVRAVRPAEAPSEVTFDIRPASPGGVYLVAGVPFASTIGADAGSCP